MNLYEFDHDIFDEDGGPGIVETLEIEAKQVQRPWSEPLIIENLTRNGICGGRVNYRAQLHLTHNSDKSHIHRPLPPETPAIIESQFGVKLMGTIINKMGKEISLVVPCNLDENIDRAALWIEPYRIPGILARFFEKQNSNPPAGLALLYEKGNRRDNTAANVREVTDCPGKIARGLLDNPKSILIAPAGTNYVSVLLEIVKEFREKGESGLFVCESPIWADYLAMKIQNQIEKLDSAQMQTEIMRFPYPTQRYFLENNPDDLMNKVIESQPELLNLIARCDQYRQIFKSSRNALRQDLRELHSFLENVAKLENALNSLELDLFSKVDIISTTTRALIARQALWRRQFDNVVLIDAGSMPTTRAQFAATFARKRVLVIGDPYDVPQRELSSRHSPPIWSANIFQQPDFRDVWSNTDAGGKAYQMATTHHFHPKTVRVMNLTLYENPLSSSKYDSNHWPRLGVPSALDKDEPIIFYDNIHLDFRPCLDEDRNPYSIPQALFAVLLAIRFKQQNSGFPVRLLSPHASQTKLHRLFLQQFREERILAASVADNERYQESVALVDILNYVLPSLPGMDSCDIDNSFYRPWERLLLTTSQVKLILIGNCGPYNALGKGDLKRLCRSLRYEGVPFRSFPAAELLQESLSGISTLHSEAGDWAAVESDIRNSTRQVTINWPTTSRFPRFLVDLVTSSLKPATQLRLAGPISLSQKLPLLDRHVTFTEAVADDWLILADEVLWWVGGEQVVRRPGLRFAKYGPWLWYALIEPTSLDGHNSIYSAQCAPLSFLKG